MPVSSVPSIKPDAVASQKSTHKVGDAFRTTEHQEMNVIIHQGPGDDPGLGVFDKITEAEKKILPIIIVAEYCYPFNSTDHNVVERSRRI